VAERNFLHQIDLFTNGDDGYHTYRIPALATTTKGTVLAFCEGRKHGRGDAGKIDLLLRRSADGGRTWGPTQLVVSDGDMTCGNPCPVVTRASVGTGGGEEIICLPFCKNLGDGHEGMIVEGKAPRTVWITRSRDDGLTWEEPEEITADVKDPSWTWYATGPGHGIQLQSGRLVVPCDHIVGIDFNRGDPYHSHVIVSDDVGASWRIGGIVPDGTNESAVAELADGSLYINCRNYRGEKRRAAAWSRDGGDSFGDHFWEEQLVEPICQASMVGISGGDTHGRDRVLFANPASEAREKLTVRVSLDGCRSWSAGRELFGGPAAYSDLALAGRDGEILCLYERGADNPYEYLTLARFDLGWLEATD